MADPRKVGARIWDSDKRKVQSCFKSITNSAQLLRDAPHTAKSAAIAIATDSAAALAAFIEMVDIMEAESIRLHRKIEELENGNHDN